MQICRRDTINSQIYQWTYDQTGGGFSNGIGRLTTASFPEGSTSYAYDPLGRVLSATQTLGAVAGGNSLTIVQSVAYTYDPAGHVTSITYPSGRVVSISYTQGYPTSMSLAATSGATPAPLMTNMVFTPFGQALSWNWNMASGPLSYARVFDTNGRQVRYPLGAFLRDVSYDAAGRITQYTHYQGSIGASTAIPMSNLDQQFGYDGLGHLTQANTTPTTWSFTYDANGNRTSTTINGGTAGAYTIDSASNKITAIAVPAISLTYDAAGNILADNNFTLAYDLRGRLASVTFSGSPTNYTYDNAGQRVRKVNTGTATTELFVYDQSGHLLGEYDQNGNALLEYVWLGDQPVAVFTPNLADPTNAALPPVAYYVYADHLNTPQVVVDTNNATRWSWMPEPFGTTAPNTSPSGLARFTYNLRFPGQYYDAESGMHYNMQRNYVPGIGRYAQSDPIGLEGGINTYNYSGADSVNRVDADGLRWVCVVPLGCSYQPDPSPSPPDLPPVTIPPFIPWPSVPDWINEMASPGSNVVDTKIRQDYDVAASDAKLCGKPPPDRCEWLNANAKNYTPAQVKATEKAWGCRRSRARR